MEHHISADSTSEKALILKNIHFSYHSKTGEIKALENVSFSVDKGEFLAIVGPSGCGKSTLLNIISGLILPEAGTVNFSSKKNNDGTNNDGTNNDGTNNNKTNNDETNNSKKEKNTIGYMLQHDHLFEWRTIYENVTLGLEIQNQMTKENIGRVLEMLENYGLNAFKDKKPNELSGGMKQRAALIRTLALNPDILLLDEPFSALDYQTRLMVSSDIGKIIKSSNKTAILVTHNLSEAISMADRVLIFSKRPSTIKKEYRIHLTLPDESPLAYRNAPEFQTYFNQIWEALIDES